jgi:hypothetical protein
MNLYPVPDPISDPGFDNSREKNLKSNFFLFFQIFLFRETALSCLPGSRSGTADPIEPDPIRILAMTLYLPF